MAKTQGIEWSLRKFKAVGIDLDCMSDSELFEFIKHLKDFQLEIVKRREMSRLFAASTVIALVEQYIKERLITSRGN